MADNTQLNIGGGGDVIGSDDIAGVKYQRVKLIHGIDGVNDGDVSAASPLPITSGTLPIQVTDWITEVGFGAVPGTEIILIRARDHDCTTVRYPVWDGAYGSDNETLLGSADTIFVASTSVNDTNAAGTGMRTIRIEGLDTAGDPQTVDLPLTGQVAAETTETWTAVNKIYGITAGSSENNEGTIWVGDGTFTLGIPTVKYTQIRPSYGRSMAPVYTVPNGKVLVLWGGLLLGGTEADAISWHLELHQGGTHQVLASLPSYGSVEARIPNSFLFPAASQLILTAKCVTGPQSVSGWLTFIERDV